ncbi:MAG: hypothetical protein GY868_13120, partial [Deltaproteobacteria bacterium]|nr:hypothetical protein [Deltaproteobacteria bacterium]
GVTGQSVMRWFDGTTWNSCETRYENGCLLLDINGLTSPSLQDLTGTAFVVAHYQETTSFEPTEAGADITAEGTASGTTSLPRLSLNGFVDFDEQLETHSFSIANSSKAGQLSWRVGEIEYLNGAEWIIGVEPAEGLTTSVSTVDVAVSRAGLDPGVYTAKLYINSNGGNEYILVSMDVAGQS